MARVNPTWKANEAYRRARISADASVFAVVIEARGCSDNQKLVLVPDQFLHDANMSYRLRHHDLGIALVGFDELTLRKCTWLMRSGRRSRRPPRGVAPISRVTPQSKVMPLAALDDLDEVFPALDRAMICCEPRLTGGGSLGWSARRTPASRLRESALQEVAMVATSPRACGRPRGQRRRSLNLMAASSGAPAGVGAPGVRTNSYRSRSIDAGRTSSSPRSSLPCAVGIHLLDDRSDLPATRTDSMTLSISSSRPGRP